MRNNVQIKTNSVFFYNYRFKKIEYVCFQPPLGSSPGASQPEMEKFDLDYLAADPAHVNFRKKVHNGNRQRPAF
jgi:hypothetical protein